MLRQRRETGPTANGGSFSVTRWDDETGDADIVEYDQSGRVICRHEWRLSTTTRDRHAGEMVTFDRYGRETGRRPLMHGGADDVSSFTSG